MLNDLLEQLRRYDMVKPGDRVYVAVSGGADSMALLWGLFLLKEKLGIALCAAHFNHHLRGEESDRDAEFVRAFCHRWDIPLEVSQGQIVPGKKGLEAAAREARYAFLRKLPGKIATAHTADDNAETVLMHLVRGTGLKGLGGITPVSGNVLRPMLSVTREQVMAFLEENHIPHMEDSSNAGDAFLRNRLRHHVIPLLRAENPRLAENISAMAGRLRQDEEALSRLAEFQEFPSVTELRQQKLALRSRMLERFLKNAGVKEPEAEHIALAENLIFSDKPSASANFPGGVTVCRNYDALEVLPKVDTPEAVTLPMNGVVELPYLGLQVVCREATELTDSRDSFTVCPEGKIVLRTRQSGDAIRLSGGTKTLKKLFIDRKIPASQRHLIPVICDEAGILGVWGIGADQNRLARELPAVTIQFQAME
ncbi:MAG: tRNA lysidine(34) synthetase TilS [Ruminococcaceae bacterium]|nr:tRNA lysidine(34) synthetase TilS [Oscillospiraceae bacterium]